MVKKAVKKKAPEKIKEVKILTKKERLVAIRNVEKLKEQGWKVVNKPVTDKHERVLGAKSLSKPDVVLMEK